MPGPDFMPGLLDMLQDQPRAWVYPFAGGRAPTVVSPSKKPRSSGMQNWENALSRKRLEWLERQPRHHPPKPRASGRYAPSPLSRAETVGAIQTTRVTGCSTTGRLVRAATQPGSLHAGGGSGIASSSGGRTTNAAAFLAQMVMQGSAVEDDASSTTAGASVPPAPASPAPTHRAVARSVTEPSNLRPTLAHRLLDAYPHENHLTLGLRQREPYGEHLRGSASSSELLGQRRRPGSAAHLRSSGSDAGFGGAARPRSAGRAAFGIYHDGERLGRSRSAAGLLAPPTSSWGNMPSPAGSPQAPLTHVPPAEHHDDRAEVGRALELAHKASDGARLDADEMAELVKLANGMLSQV